VKAAETPYAIAYGANRHPAWRFVRATQLVRDRIPPHPLRDDAAILAMRRYLITRRDYGRRVRDTEELEFVLAERFKQVWNAERIYSRGEDSRSRYELEALILARQPVSKIASRLSIDTKTVVTYEKLFFNVADKINSRGFIVANAILPTFMSGLSNRTPSGAAKYFAYFAGVHALNAILDAFSENYAPLAEEHDWESWATSKFREAFATSAVVSMMYMEPTQFNVRNILEGFYNLIALSHRERVGTGGNNNINAAFEIFVQNNKQLVGSEADSNQPVMALPGVNPSVEPRVRDYIASSSGDADVMQDYSADTWVPPDKRRVLDLKAVKKILEKPSKPKNG